MQHLDPDTVALAAVGETVDAKSTAHLADCIQCSTDVEELRDVVFIARDGGHEELEQPSPAVWEAISRELGLDGTNGATASPSPSLSPSPSSLEERRRAKSPRHAGRWLAAAAVVGVIAGGGAFWAVDAIRGDGGAVLARTELSALPNYETSGEATITEGDGGARTLDVTVEGEGPEGYREVWLIAPDLQRMYSVGLMDGDDGSFTVPADLDLAQFPIVDVSDEPYDGDPTHSSVSMVRGTVQLPGS